MLGRIRSAIPENLNIAGELIGSQRFLKFPSRFESATLIIKSLNCRQGIR